MYIFIVFSCLIILNIIFGVHTLYTKYKFYKKLSQDVENELDKASGDPCKGHRNVVDNLRDLVDTYIEELRVLKEKQNTN